jgi:hypothetical protein
MSASTGSVRSAWMDRGTSEVQLDGLPFRLEPAKTRVALSAKDSANSSAGVVVVDGRLGCLAQIDTAERAAPVLGFLDGAAFVKRHAVTVVGVATLLTGFLLVLFESLCNLLRVVQTPFTLNSARLVDVLVVGASCGGLLLVRVSLLPVTGVNVKARAAKRSGPALGWGELFRICFPAFSASYRYTSILHYLMNWGR